MWIKRDDMSGFAFGGNKGRKLEFIMADALARSSEVLVTCGSSQSNFVRQLGAACSVFGLKCAAAVMDLPFESAKPYGRPLRRESGNVILDRILCVDLRFHPDGTWNELYALAEELAREYEAQGLAVYRVPIGGSSALGAYAFVEGANELSGQAGPFDFLVVASSSGSTQTGLAYALHDSRTNVVGIACDPEPDLPSDFAKLSAELHALSGSAKPLRAADFDLRLDYVGPGYGLPSKDGRAAIETMARAEGLFLDPVYSGKAFAGLIDLVRRNEIGGRVLFWHTGGLPALFAADEEWQASVGPDYPTKGP